MQKRRSLFIVASIWIGIAGAGNVYAQEASIEHGFLFFSGEKYVMDEKTYGIYEDGNRFEDLIKENADALSEFGSYETWHTTALVMTGFSLASFAFGGVYYMFEKDLSESLGENAGIYGLAAGGGLLVLGVVSEFLAWGSISDAAETYNRGLMDEGPAMSMMYQGPSIVAGPDGVNIGWTFAF